MNDTIWLSRKNICKIMYDRKKVSQNKRDIKIANKLNKMSIKMKAERQKEMTHRKNKFVQLMCNQKFHISLILPTIFGIFIPLIEVKEYVVCFSFLMGVFTQPLIKTIGEIYNKDESDGN
jgi:hypothetical protein